ncbi:helix-turn-helix domain-containing protein [Anaerostipes caccae]|uniref:helix-turn-helix domain-containing protein n=1 Tax=Anaerostipes caccae TaxID=105841 RepID=UPI0038D38C6B
MAELGLTQKDVGGKMVWNCAAPTVSQKINGIRPMTIGEADSLARLLDLTDEEYKEYFFAKEIAQRNQGRFK